MSESEKTPPDDELGALGRWSQRKRRAARGEVLEDEPVVEERPSHATADAAPSDAGESELTDADMPSLESIDAQTDLAGFFSPKVSETLRREALRRYFHLPDVHVVDRMNEYEGDYRSFQPLGDLVPEEMKRKLAQEAERLGRKLLEGGEESERADKPDGGPQLEVAAHAHDDKEENG